MEIERKFLVKTLPHLENYPYKKIVQAYVSNDPVIRIRQMGESFFLTVKNKGQIAREEFEMPISSKQFQKLWKKTEGTPIEKNRYFIPLENSLTAELDVYFGELEGLYTVEVEFASLKDSEAFQPPDWFGLDVSLDKRYKNNQLTQFGLPK